jgi:Peptidase family M23
MKFLYLFISLSLCSFTKNFTHFDHQYPKDFFSSPVLHPIEVTGTFGELRNNHFHGGLDIRPERSGVSETIVAAADGYVSRIQVSAYGYGKLLQITHNNGFTTLYAHLDDFSPAINDYVKANQYAQESYEINLSPNATDFFVRKGEKIGMMGNTGGSQGTHLHFEIREIGSEHPLNPLLFGFNVPDDKSPKFYELKIYSLDEKHETISSREINLRAQGTKKKIKVKKGKKVKYKTIYTPPPADSPYTIEGDTIEVAAEQVGFGIKTYDTANWSGNTNGIYDLSLYQNENLIYNFNVEKFEFAETRYINAHIDYAEKMRGGGLFNRCYRLPGNQLSMYKNLQNDGVIALYEGQINEVMIVAKDANANPDTLIFYIKKKTDFSVKKEKNYAQYLDYNGDNTFNSGSFEAYFPYSSLYESCYLTFSQAENNNPLAFSPTYRLHNASTPLHKSIDIKIQPQKVVPDSLADKLFVAFKASDGDLLFCGNTWQGNFLVGKNDNFGNYFIAADTTAPSIKPVRFSENMQNESRMSFRISDNVKAGRNGLKWRATIDGQWILLEHDTKSPVLTHYFDHRIAAGEHELIVEAEDKSGNKSFFIKKFIR